MTHLPRATHLAHQLIEERLGEGDSAIDATAGNGHDTAFLLRCVGERGKVYAFDIQEEAIRATAERCQSSPRLKLLHTGHENIGKHVGSPIQAAMFNLGYLPGSDKSKITLPDSTVRGVHAALELLSPRGRLTVVLYTGHEGGKEEAESVFRILGELPQEKFAVANYRFLNQKNSPPELLVVEKRS